MGPDTYRLGKVKERIAARDHQPEVSLMGPSCPGDLSAMLHADEVVRKIHGVVNEP